MSWYRAHIITWLKYLTGKQDNYPVNENIVLIEVPNAEEAWRKAEEIGKKYEVQVTVGRGHRCHAGLCVKGRS